MSPYVGHPRGEGRAQDIHYVTERLLSVLYKERGKPRPAPGPVLSTQVEERP